MEPRLGSELLLSCHTIFGIYLAIHLSTQTCTSHIYIYMYVYVHIYIYREREIFNYDLAYATFYSAWGLAAGTVVWTEGTANAVERLPEKL